MSLIECILEYAHLVSNYGRERGKNFLNDVVAPELHLHITHSVNNCGCIVDSSGNEISFRDMKSRLEQSHLY